jgi:large subunit ribosomal protein L22
MADKDDAKQKDQATEKPKRAPAKPKATKDAGAKAKPEGAQAKAAGSKPRATRKKAPDSAAETKAPRKRATTRKPAAAKAEPEAEAKAKPESEPKDETAAPKPARRRAPRSGATAARRRRAPAPAADRDRPAPQRPVVRAKAKYVHSSARKARLVMEHVRGKSVGDARAVLQHSPRGVARDVQRLLESAIANAENNHDLVGDDLYVKEIYADEGPTLKRFRPRAQGRVYRVRKRTSHLSVALSTKE